MSASSNALQFTNLDEIRGWLGLEQGGSAAMLALAFLVGGDYHQGGEHVGLKSAAACLRFLLKGQTVIASRAFRIFLHKSDRVAAFAVIQLPEPPTVCILQCVEPCATCFMCVKLRGSSPGAWLSSKH